jgi:hypothetical protein
MGRGITHIGEPRRSVTAFTVDLPSVNRAVYIQYMPPRTPFLEREDILQAGPLVMLAYVQKTLLDPTIGCCERMWHSNKDLVTHSRGPALIV